MSLRDFLENAQLRPQKRLYKSFESGSITFTSTVKLLYNGFGDLHWILSVKLSTVISGRFRAKIFGDLCVTDCARGVRHRLCSADYVANRDSGSSLVRCSLEETNISKYAPSYYRSVKSIRVLSFSTWWKLGIIVGFISRPKENKSVYLSARCGLQTDKT